MPINRACGHSRVWTIVFPLLAPATFSVQMVGTVYAFLGIFHVIPAVAIGGPAKATVILVNKVHNDGGRGEGGNPHVNRHRLTVF